jgi:hypothetical protein
MKNSLCRLQVIFPALLHFYTSPKNIWGQAENEETSHQGWWEVAVYLGRNAYESSGIGGR